MLDLDRETLPGFKAGVFEPTAGQLEGREERRVGQRNGASTFEQERIKEAMTKQHERLEQALGGRLETRAARVIPGTVAVEGTEFVYFADDGKNAFRRQFRKLTEFANPPHASSGGVNERGCKITLPDGRIFHAIGYHGDLEGWRTDIELGAQALQLFLARVEGDRFVVSDGRSFALPDCGIEWS